MTLPRERSLSLQNTREFLRSLLDPKLTPRIPKEIRKQAYWCLKHFPADYEVEAAAEVLPKIWGKLKK